MIAEIVVDPKKGIKGLDDFTKRATKEIAGLQRLFNSLKLSLSTKPLEASVKRTSKTIRNVRLEQRRQLREQKQILAGLIVEGKQSTEVFRKQQKTVREAAAQFKDYEKARKQVDKLTDSATKSNREIRKNLREQQEGLAQLIISGKKGTAEYRDQVRAVGAARAELLRYNRAAKEAGQISLGLSGESRFQRFAGGAGSRLRQLSGVAPVLGLGATGLEALAGGRGRGAGGAKGGGGRGAGVKGVAAIAGLAVTAVALKKIVTIGAEFQTTVKDMQATLAATDEQTAELAKRARELGLKWGVDATQGIDAFKLVIAKLGPEVAKNQDALQSLADTSLLFSIAGGVDAAEATKTLSVVVSQFGFDSLSATDKAKKFIEIANILVAASNEGAAEVPELSAALTVVGATASEVGLSVAETAAALELLAKGNIEGARGGKQFRNILLNLSTGSKQANEALSQMGLTFADINPKAVGLQVSLERLKSGYDTLKDPILEANAITKLFGKENTNAALVLLEAGNQLDAYTEKIEDTTAAEVAAATRSATLAKRWSTLVVRLEDFAITLFDSLEPALSATIDVLSALLDILSPVISLVGFLIKAVANLVKWVVDAIKSIVEWVKSLAFVREALALVAKVIGEVVKWLKNAESATKVWVNDLKKNLQKGLQTVALTIRDSIIPAITGFIERIKGLKATKEALAKAISAVVKWFKVTLTWIGKLLVKIPILGAVFRLLGKWASVALQGIAGLVRQVKVFLGLLDETENRAKDIVSAALDKADRKIKVVREKLEEADPTPPVDVGGGGFSGLGGGGGGGAAAAVKADPLQTRLDALGKLNERAIAAIEIAGRKQLLTEADIQQSLLEQEVVFQLARQAAAKEHLGEQHDDFVLFVRDVSASEASLTDFIKEQGAKRVKDHSKRLQEKATISLNQSIAELQLRLRSEQLIESAITGTTEEALNDRFRSRVAQLEIELRIARINAVRNGEDVLLINKEFAQKRKALEDSHLKGIRDLQVEALDDTIDLLQQEFSWRKVFVDAALELWDVYYDELDEKRREDLQKELSSLDEQTNDLVRQLARREITFEEFDNSIAQLNAKRFEVQNNLEKESFDLSKAIKETGIAFAASIEEDADAEAKNRRDKFLDFLKNSDEKKLERQRDLIQKSIEDTGKALDSQAAAAQASEEIEKETADARKAILDNLVLHSVAQLGVALAEGERLAQATLKILVDAAVTWLETMIPVWIAGATGVTLSTLGPLGLFVAGGLIAAIKLAAAAAKSALSSVTFHEGTSRVGGPSVQDDEEVPALLQGGEGVVNRRAAGAGQNRSFINLINQSSLPLEQIPGVQRAVLGTIGRDDPRTTFARGVFQSDSENELIFQEAIRAAGLENDPATSARGIFQSDTNEELIFQEAIRAASSGATQTIADATNNLLNPLAIAQGANASIGDAIQDSGIGLVQDSITSQTEQLRSRLDQIISDAQATQQQRIIKDALQEQENRRNARQSFHLPGRFE